MTIEEKKKYLKRYKRLKEKEKALSEELINIKLDALPGGIDYSRDKVQTTSSSDQMVNYAIKVEELTNKIQAAMLESIETYNQIFDSIYAMDNELYQTVLHRRYLLSQTWEDIAYYMNYSTQRLYELHGEALTEINIREKQS